MVPGPAAAGVIRTRTIHAAGGSGVGRGAAMVGCHAVGGAAADGIGTGVLRYEAVATSNSSTFK